MLCLLQRLEGDGEARGACADLVQLLRESGGGILPKDNWERDRLTAGVVKAAVQSGAAEAEEAALALFKLACTCEPEVWTRQLGRVAQLDRAGIACFGPEEFAFVERVGWEAINQVLAETGVEDTTVVLTVACGGKRLVGLAKSV